MSVKSLIYAKKNYIWNPNTCICKIRKYLASNIDDSVIMCNEVIEKTIQTNFNEKKATCKMQNFIILLTFLLITSTLLIDVSISCHLIKYQAKQQYFLPFHDTN